MGQMTATGLVTAGLFFFLSQAKPLNDISAARPPPSVFSTSVVVSVLGQVRHSLSFSLLLLSYYHDSDDDEYTNLLQSLLCFLTLFSISYNTPPL